mmetsp:Transcript_6413/g.11741  ORF Transcript_6413/g.11741 Transcript_6413/m.11741 type:complete len:244 (-) Transcript_6413:55-786(-)
MGCCHNKELYIVCSWDWDEGELLAHELGKRQSSHPQEEKQQAQPCQGVASAASQRRQTSNAQVDESLLKPRLRTPLHLTGNFADWSTSFAPSRLQQVPWDDGERKGRVRLKLCVELTSQSFSFQVVSPDRDWDWRLYPRDAQRLSWAHVSKEGRLVANEPGAVPVAVGDLATGHGLNFHVVERADYIVTVWVEVPTRPSEKQETVDLDFAGSGSKVWYTVEDTGVQYKGGDGVDLDRYRWLTG